MTQDFLVQNIGATNVLRIGGWKLGFVTLIFDITKGFIPIKLLIIHNQKDLLVFAILGVICGHLYPIWLKFKGGKGVAAFIGILLGYDLFFLFFSFTITWIFFSILFKYSSFSALMAIFVNIILVLNLNEQKITFLTVSLMIIYKHKDNIKRLLKGEESKINLKKKIKF